MLPVDRPSNESWRALSPSQGRTLLAALSEPWWIAGGWALDLFLGKVTRPHKDLDIGVFRRDAARVLAALPGWEFFEAKDGTLTQIVAGNPPRAEVNSLWCRRADTALWELELMLDELVDDRWIFRRDPRIDRPLATAFRRTAEGIAYLSPEIQLLYKARATRTQDQADFDRVVPRLDSEARTWLHGALARMDPDHPWLSVLHETSQIWSSMPGLHRPTAR